MYALSTYIKKCSDINNPIINKNKLSINVYIKMDLKKLIFFTKKLFLVTV